MPQFLPLFPLKIVAFPGEELNLHIFEPRYKQLILECVDDQKAFGMPSFVDEQLSEFGTEMEVLRVERTYDDGKMDITVRGGRVFRILEFLREVPNRLFSAAVVDFRKDSIDHKAEVASALFGYFRQLQMLLGLKKPVIEKPSDIRAYAIAHHVGLDIKQEFELLRYASESERQRYLIGHLRQLIPALMQAERIRERARQNGHFRPEESPEF